MSTMRENPYFAYRSFWPELQTMENLYHCGIDTICFYPANTLNSLGEPYCKYPPNWLWYDAYDFSVVDKQISDIVEKCPDVKLICMIDLNSPEWLVKNRICFDSFNELGRVVGNDEWRKLVASYLRAFLAHAEKNHPQRIVAYALACGRTCEWMDFSLGTESPHKTRAFREWCHTQGKGAPDDIPAPSLRTRLSRHEMLRDPQSDRIALDYWRFCSELVADTIKYFVDAARETVKGSKHIGVFYGYAIELNGDRFVSLSHLAYERVLDHPGIDFLISPGTYRDRVMGGGSGFMSPYGTVRLKDKAFMHECDQRTHTYNANLTPYVTMKDQHWQSEESTIAGLRREMSLALINQASLWWFDMWGGFYQGQTVLANFRLMREIWSRYAKRQFRSISEVAMIIDPDSCYYLHPTDSNTENYQFGMQDDSFLHGIRDKLNRLGAPYDIYSMNDISKIDELERYKCVIFCTPFEITPEKEAILHEYILRDKRTVIWLYAPGISDGENWSPERVRLFSGVDFLTPGISRTDMGNWQSVYVSSPAELSVEAFKDIVAASGAHIYCRESLPVYANSGLLAIHSADGGVLRIHLPRSGTHVKELFSGDSVPINDATFEYEFPAPGTCLFRTY